VKITKTRLAGAAVLTAIAGGTVFGAPTSSAEKYDTPKPVVIKAVFNGKGAPKYTGPSKVAAGAKLTVLNDSNPKKIGPHTWAVVEKSAIPKTKADLKDCGKNLGGLCGVIAKALKVNLKTFAVGKPSVDVGKKGWDKAFGKKGDVFYSETEGESQTRVVKAKAGTTLTFFCAVHPEMQKTLKVTG
jgi:hypothetical protein